MVYFSVLPSTSILILLFPPIIVLPEKPPLSFMNNEAFTFPPRTDSLPRHHSNRTRLQPSQ